MKCAMRTSSVPASAVAPRVAAVPAVHCVETTGGCMALDAAGRSV